MLILGLVGMYIDAAFVFVTNSLLLFRLLMAMLCKIVGCASMCFKSVVMLEY